MSSPSDKKADTIRQVRDEDLVKRAKEKEERAFEELVRRFGPRHHAQIHKLIRQRALTKADRPDALNVALIGLLVAVKRFDLTKWDESGGCSFASFAWRVVHDTLCSFVREVKRLDGHLDRSQPASAVLESRSDAAGRRLHRTLNLTELLERLKRLAMADNVRAQEALSLVPLLLEGLSLRQSAKQLGIPDTRAHRRKDDLCRWIRQELGNCD